MTSSIEGGGGGKHSATLAEKHFARAQADNNKAVDRFKIEILNRSANKLHNHVSQAGMFFNGDRFKNPAMHGEINFVGHNKG